MSNKDLQLRWLAVILFLLFIGECKSTKRIQRRFMWKQVDDTMDGIFDSMASSARAMKSMIGDFIPGMATPPTHPLMHSHIMDYLPSETTKIKYIIHSPTTKPMKVIKMSAPKKVVKVMSVHKPVIESQHNKPKYNFGHSVSHLRQLEKEQELIAEGHFSGKTVDEKHKNHKDVISGQIQEFSSDWQPMSTVKPYPMSHLYTNALSEPLPNAEKQIYDSVNKIGNIYEENKRKNVYEVTEHTPEETVAVPYTQHYENSRGFIPIRSAHSSKQQHTARLGLSRTTSAPRSTSTTEAPNYPPNFLKRNRERPAQMPKQFKSASEVNWVRPSNASISEAKPTPTQLLQLPLKSQNWALLGPTINPTMLLHSTATKLRNPEPLVQPTFNERLKPKTIKNVDLDRPRDIRQRGSVKFGDKLAELYKK